MLKYLGMLLRRLREKEREKECEHEWEVTKTTHHLACDICGKILGTTYFLVCKRCGCESVKREEEKDIKTMTWDSKTISLCNKCYREFRGEVEEIKKAIEQSVERIPGLIILSETRVLRFTNLQSLKYYLYNYIEMISDVREIHNGLVFFAIPKIPLATPYRIVFPYLAVIDYMRTRRLIKKEGEDR